MFQFKNEVTTINLDYSSRTLIGHWDFKLKNEVKIGNWDFNLISF